MANEEKTPKTPKRYEDFTFSELINLRRQQRQTKIQLEKQFRGFPRNPIIDNRSRPNAARGARPNTFYKQQRRNLNNGQVQIQAS